MSFRSIVRGDSTVDVKDVKQVLRDECGFDDVDISPVDGDNWLSVPLVVNDEFFLKVVTVQNAWTHSLFTTARNLGARVSGNGPFFETFGSPVEMARHEFESARRMREAGVRAPEPVDVIEGDREAFLLFEYLDGFETLSDSELEAETVREVFRMLRRLHDDGLAHGDLSLENVLVVDGDVYFIDSTGVAEDGHDDAVAYDLACALGALSSRLSPSVVVDLASEFFDAGDLRHALDFVTVARLRPGIEESFSLLELRKAVAEATEDAS